MINATFSFSQCIGLLQVHRFLICIFSGASVQDAVTDLLYGLALMSNLLWIVGARDVDAYVAGAFTLLFVLYTISFFMEFI